ncbi:Dehydrogenase aclE [Psilocybe cubensis]|uniref:Gfo/Idh/MocA-like oxidoreductase N-terminal domain-containing protein n=2 Tax=Psilocybe cubensis TaxID=181762 RepID=A0A8H7XX88_PSICU|nr:Dehydrogenase aclE [Psilocybe cubensis]KAH9478946.1 Dehydrogenase aclE [Psilocybe cubensis]
MSTTTPIKVGFVGLSTTGWASAVLGPALLQDSLKNTYDLVAVSTSSEESARASAEKYSKEVGHPIEAYFGSTEQIAADPNVDLVAISVKAPYHKALVLPVIQAKKDIFIEWPAGASLEETEEIAEAARVHGVRTIVGLQTRHQAAIQKVRELLSSGIIGTVRSTNITNLIPREGHLWIPFSKEKDLYLVEHKNGATQLHIPILHLLDTVSYLLGDFSSITATSTIAYPTGTVVDNDGKPTPRTYAAQNPDHFSITGILPGGVLANLFWRSGYALGKGRRMYMWEIEGDEGVIRIESSSPFPSVVEPEVYLNGTQVDLDGPTGAVHTIGAAWKDFAEHGSHHATIEDAVKNHKLIDAIEKSAREGKTIHLSL